MPESLLRLSNISKSFGAVQALQQVSFELCAGEVHAVVGENGAGKSTLVQVMTGALRPDWGNIEVEGHPVGHLSPAQACRLGITCVYQHPALFPELSVAENIGLRLGQFPPLRRIDWKEQRSKAQRLLERIGAGISPSTLVRELSMPHQQLVEIACALGAEARIIIMDEPTASLTQREQALLFQVVRDLRRQGTGVIYVSHRLEEIFALADRVTVLRDGHSVRTCPTAELSEQSLIRLMVGRDLPATVTRPTTAARTEPQENQVVLRLRQVGCSASGVADVTFELRQGEILGLAGLVGAGRTELARTLFGITPADAGDIQVCGQSVVVDSPRTAVTLGIACVPEDRTSHGVIHELPVAQNITLAIHHVLFPGGWLRPGKERAIAVQYVAALDIRPPQPDALVAALSGGNQQKVSVARWLATQPRVLILDEPTQGVDIGAKSEIHTLIRRLAQEGMAILLISSDLPELLALSDRIGVMRAGRLVAFFPSGTESHEIMSAAFGQNVAA